MSCGTLREIRKRLGVPVQPRNLWHVLGHVALDCEETKPAGYTAPVNKQRLDLRSGVQPSLPDRVIYATGVRATTSTTRPFFMPFISIGPPNLGQTSRPEEALARVPRQFLSMLL